MCRRGRRIERLRTVMLIGRTGSILNRSEARLPPPWRSENRRLSGVGHDHGNSHVNPPARMGGVVPATSREAGRSGRHPLTAKPLNRRQAALPARHRPHPLDLRRPWPLALLPCPCAQGGRSVLGLPAMVQACSVPDQPTKGDPVALGITRGRRCGFCRRKTQGEEVEGQRPTNDSMIHCISGNRFPIPVPIPF